MEQTDALNLKNPRSIGMLKVSLCVGVECGSSYIARGH